jgi:hypothetical protein
VDERECVMEKLIVVESKCGRFEVEARLFGSIDNEWRGKVPITNDGSVQVRVWST